MTTRRRKKAKRVQAKMHLSVSFCCGSPAITGTQQPDFIHGKTFREPGDRASAIFFFFPAVKQIASLGYMSVTQGLFRFCSCFEFNALPISLNPRPLESEAETTDDQKVEYTDKKGNKSQDVSFKPDSFGGLCLPGLRRKNGSILQGFGHHHQQ